MNLKNMIKGAKMVRFCKKYGVSQLTVYLKIV
jgi:hypothetical protein